MHAHAGTRIVIIRLAPTMLSAVRSGDVFFPWSSPDMDDRFLPK